MPIKVYVWKPKGDDSYGHASMELSDGTYISWWPEYGGKAEQAKKKAHGFQNRTLEDDVRDEERNPDRTFIIPSKVGLDEGEIKKWWAKKKAKRSGIYSTIVVMQSKVQLRLVELKLLRVV